ncbi:MAG: DUF2029 domain-containing protein [Bacteroidetes bacterium]|nr:MAG: DUF2029 domain-containing protein [Bacteroidota bacterium]
MLLLGEDFSTSYDSATFQSKIKEYGIENVLDAPKNLPTNALLFLPIAWLPPLQAKIAWTLFSVLCLYLALYFLFKSYDIQFFSPGGMVVCIMILLFKPIYVNIALGQMYLFLLALFSSAVYCMRANYLTTTGTLISTALLLKGYGAFPFVFAAFIHRKFKLWVTVFLLPIVFLITLPFFGLNSWQIYYESVFITLGRLPLDSHVAYQTINGWVRHLLIVDETLPTVPNYYFPAWIVEITVGITLLYVVLYIGYYANRHAKQNIALSFAACVAASVIIAPLAEEYHYVLFLPLFTGMVSITLLKRKTFRELMLTDYLLVLSFLFMAMPLGYTKLQSIEFPVFLLAYPKLYAGLLMLFLFGHYVRNQTKTYFH